MSKVILIALVLIPLLICACGKTQQLENNIDTISEDEYKIYLVVVDKVKQERENPLWIVNQTKYGRHKSKEEFFKYFDKVEEQDKIKADNVVKDDFFGKNKKHYKLDNKFSAIKNTLLVSQQQVDVMVHDNESRWGDDKKLPAYINLSRVGFDTTKTQALLYYESIYGILDAVGMYIFLIKENDKWTIKREVMAWIS